MKPFLNWLKTTWPDLMNLEWYLYSTLASKQESFIQIKTHVVVLTLSNITIVQIKNFLVNPNSKTFTKPSPMMITTSSDLHALSSLKLSNSLLTLSLDSTTAMRLCSQWLTTMMWFFAKGVYGSLRSNLPQWTLVQFSFCLGWFYSSQLRFMFVIVLK